MEHAIRSLIRNIPDFPKPGIQFKDITPLLGDPDGFAKLIEWFSLSLAAGEKPEVIAGIESRGFIIGAAVAHKLGLGFAPIRKPGKLPYKTKRVDYQLEYGTDAVEMHIDGVKQGQ